MSIEKISYKDKIILCIKYTGLSPEQMQEQIKTATKMIIDSRANDNLVLTDMSDCFVNEDFIELAKRQGKLSLPFCAKSAIVGLTGIKKMLLKGVNAISPKSRIPFDTIEEAQEWLVQ